MYYLDFGRIRRGCRVMDEGFVLWEINGDSGEVPVSLEGTDAGLIVHVLVMEGSMKIGWEDRTFELAKDSFTNLIDGQRLEVAEMSGDVRAYMMIFSAKFITSLLKDTPPFPPSYVLKVKVVPMTVISQDTMKLFLKRIGAIRESFDDTAHHFRTEMLKCELWMFMLDMADRHIRHEDENDSLTETGRKNILFKQFIRLMLAHIRDNHSVTWYASQLCVTPQYLNRVVKSSSQKTAYGHICTTLTGAVIDRLENTDEPISLIAEDFHFPDQATLTKFFKRHTGKTPSEYRKTAALL